jgi:hypothetical protein
MVIRLLSGHAAREYSSGKRVICGEMVEGLKKMINFRTNYYSYNLKQIMENTMLIFPRTQFYQMVFVRVI